MLSDITTGNAKEDGRSFRFWFVGQVEKWCAENGIPFDKENFGLRNTDDIEIKWGIYKKGDKRDVWASSSGRTAMSMLVRVDFIFNFRKIMDHNQCREVRLKDEGDYVIWLEDMEHNWQMIEDSEILTLRW